MSHHLLSLTQTLYVVCFAILKSSICKNVQSEKALVQNWRENLSVRTFEVTMLTMSFWLLMLTGNEFWQDFWETYEISSKYELPQVDATNPSSFYCSSVSETRYSHLSPYRSFSLTCIWWAAMQISWNKRKFLLEKRVQSPKDFFYTSTWPPFFCFVHQYGRRDVMWQRSVGRQGVLHLKPAETSANNPCISYFV